MRLGLFIQIEDSKMWMVVSGAIAAARHQRADLVVYASPSEADHAMLDRTFIESCYNFRRTEHNGAILSFAGDKALRYAQELWGEGFPTMLIGRRSGAVPFTSNNHQETMRNSVHVMVEKGHHKIAFLAGPPANLSAAEKQAGYMQGLAQNGLVFDANLVIPGDYTQATARENTAALLQGGTQFTALIASNDLGAIGAMEALKEAGLAPGADVEVLGFDNIPQSHWTRPALSTYDPHYYQMGHRACTELAYCVSKRNYIISAIVPAVYIPRETTWESSTEDEMEHPLASDWLENKFMYEAQFEILKANEKAAPLLDHLQTALLSPGSFLQTFKEILFEAGSLGLSAGCLFPVLHQSLKTLGGKDAEQSARVMIRQACALQTAVLFDEQRRTTERAARYSIASFELRQLSLSDAREETVLASLGHTFAALGLNRAGVYLHDQTVRINEEGASSGRWHEWIHGLAKSLVPADKFEFSLMDQAPDTLIYLPLVENAELIGVMLLDASNEFLNHFAVLARQFSTALRAARLHRDLARANSELVETSRLAGLAEMATGVLHNIGNALNGVNTNCSLMAERLHKSRIPSVARVAELLRKHEADLPGFLLQDPKGAQVVPYISQLGDQLNSEQKNIEADLSELRAMVDHINEIVAAQQSYAQISGVIEDVQPAELLEFALRLGEASLTRHHVQVERFYETVPDVRIQRQKAVQILVNLIRNAKESMDLGRKDHKILQLTVRLGKQNRVEVEVRDNGTGINPENLARIFNFGFTTKPGGHGFGLHNSALAAKEMGGRLTAWSEGHDTGARFILELPSSTRS